MNNLSTLGRCERQALFDALAEDGLNYYNRFSLNPQQVNSMLKELSPSDLALARVIFDLSASVSYYSARIVSKKLAFSALQEYSAALTEDDISTSNYGMLLSVEERRRKVLSEIEWASNRYNRGCALLHELIYCAVRGSTTDALIQACSTFTRLQHLVANQV